MADFLVNLISRAVDASIAALPHMGELNIGHSIIARAVLVGLEVAVREMAEIIQIASGAAGEG